MNFMIFFIFVIYNKDFSKCYDKKEKKFFRKTSSQSYRFQELLNVIDRITAI